MMRTLQIALRNLRQRKAVTLSAAKPNYYTVPEAYIATAIAAAGGVWLLSQQNESLLCDGIQSKDKRMLAFVVDGNKGDLCKVPRPIPKDGEVLIKIRRAGVCNTDLEVSLFLVHKANPCVSVGNRKFRSCKVIWDSKACWVTNS